MAKYLKKIAYLLTLTILLTGCVDQEVLTPIDGSYRGKYEATIQQQTVQVRLTEHLFHFIEDEALNLLSSFAGELLGGSSGDGDTLPFCVSPLYGTQDVNLVITNYTIAYGLCSNCISWDGTGCESTYNDCNDGSSGCGLDLKLDQILLRPLDQSNTDIDALRLSARISVNDQIALSADLSTAEGFTYCQLTLNGEASAQVDLDFTDQGSGEVGVGLGDLTINFDRFDLGGVSCFESGTDEPDTLMTTLVGIMLEFIGPTIQNQAIAQIGETIDPLLKNIESDLLCSSCTPDHDANLAGGYHCPVSAPGGSSCNRCQFNDDCPEGFNCNDGLCSAAGNCSSDQPCENGSCDLTTGTCIIPPRCMISETECYKQKLGIEGMLAIRDLLNNLYQNPGRSDLSLYINLGDQARADSNNGLTLSMMGGLYGEPNSGVSPGTTAVTSIPEGDFLQENDQNGTPYHLGIALSEQFLNRGLEQLFNAGAFNVDLDASLSDFIVTDTFSVFIPSITSLTRDNSSMMISIRPKNTPKIIFGNGTVDQEGDPVIGDSLLNIEMVDLKLEFYAFIDDHYIKLFSVLVDLYLNGAIDLDGNQLTPMLPQIAAGADKNLRNIRVIEGGILPDNSEDLENTLLSVIELALGFIPIGFEPITLPALLTYEIEISNIAMKQTGVSRFLALYTTLKKGSEVTPPTPITLPEIKSHPYYTQNGEYGYWKQHTLDLKQQYQVRYRINRGLWHPWISTNKLVLNNRLLSLPGKHQIDLELINRKGDLFTTSKQLITDPIKPSLTLKRRGEKIEVSGRDSISSGDKLRYEISIDGTPWKQLKTKEINLKQIGQENVEIRVAAIDETGNRREIKKRYTLNIPSSKEHPVETGCHYSNSSNYSLLLLLPLLLMIRFRARLKIFLIMLTILVGMGGCFDNESSGSCVTKADCPENQGCQEGACTVCSDNPYTCSDCYIPFRCDQLYHPCNEGCQCNLEQGICYPIENFCQSRKDCEAGEICNNNRCTVQEIACGGACPGGTFCCGLTDQCTPLPEACGDFYCPSGFRVSVVEEGTLSETTCNLEGVSCQCEELPPLAMGVTGKYTRLGLWNDNVVIGAYNETYGDLQIGFQNGEIIEWLFVDGVPEGEILYGPNGPRGGVAEPGDQVGEFLSMVVDQQQQIHLAYYDRTNQVLKYARLSQKEEKWSITTMVVDSVQDSGYDPAITLDQAQNPVIVYGRKLYRDGEQHYSALYLARTATNTPENSDAWDLTELVKKERYLPCNNQCTDGETCIIDPALTAQCNTLTPISGQFQNSNQQTIPEKGEITDTITINHQEHIGEVSLSLNITHPRSNELSIELISPDGAKRVVKNQNTQYQTADLTLNEIVVFSDIRGELDGNWQLKIIDHQSGISGTLNQWSLHFKRYENNSPYCTTRCITPDASCGSECEGACSAATCYESITTPTYKTHEILVGSENYILFKGDTLHILFNNRLQNRLSYLTLNSSYQIIDHIDLVRGPQVIQTGWIHRPSSIHFFYLQHTNELKHLLYQPSQPLISTIVDDGIRVNGEEIVINRIGGTLYPVEVNGDITLFYSDDAGHHILRKVFDQSGWLNDPVTLLSAIDQQHFGFFLQGVMQQTTLTLSTFYYSISEGENNSGVKLFTPKE